MLEFAELMLHFTANFADWRYETCKKVFSSLNKLRDLCENHFRKAILGACQDESLIDKVDEACRDAPLWRSPHHRDTYILEAGNRFKN